MNGNAMRAVAIHASAAGIEKNAPVKLFEAPVIIGTGGRNRFFVAPDGRRFLIITASVQVSSEFCW